jgi:phage recombination protein Bet
LPQSEELYNVLRATAFKGDVTDAQLSALMIVASQYGLNPWTKEIYAFPDKGGIVPVVGVDGWSRIINSNPQFDGMDFAQDADSCTCTIYRKDRSHPVKVTEWMAECKRNGVGPWQSHPYRMLRHKAMIQCARVAFGFGGIFDQDEAERIVEAGAPKKVNPDTGELEAVLFDVTAALDAVEACKTLDDLSATWKAEGSKAVAAKDNPGHAALKAAVKEKKVALEYVTTVEMAA